MRTSHKKINKLIADEKSKITDKEFFLSEAFAGYLEDIVEVVAKRYKRPVKVKVIYDETDENYIANTDGNLITINAGNSTINLFNNRARKTKAIIGLLGHELGHIVFGDFRLLKVFQDKLNKGLFYPKSPVADNNIEEADLEEIKNVLATDKIGRSIIFSVADTISNILEDAYVETRMITDFPGKIKSGIILIRASGFEELKTITQMIDEKYSSLVIMMNLILAYATVGRIKNEEGYNGEYLDVFSRCIKHIDNGIYTEDAKANYMSSLQILLKIWKYVKEQIEKEKEKQQGSEDEEEAKNNCNAALSQGIPKRGSTPTGGTAPANSSSQQSSSETAISEENINEIKKAVEEELGRIKPEETDTLKNGNGSGMIYRNNSYAGSEYEDSANDIERILSNIAKTNVGENEEKSLAESLQNEADSIHYGQIHRNIDITINRINPVPEYLKDNYKKVSPELLKISKRLQKGIMDAVKKRKLGEKLNGLYMGKRINTRNLIRNDGRYFYKRILPSDTLDMAVAVLVDESGSMSSCDRITKARATSIALYDFCNSLKIPISIMGHTADDEKVDLFSYADFDSVDGKDCYRLMDMCARCCNRDGAALRFVSEHLLKREEKIKLLILISDGQPYDLGYMGYEAEEDLRQIRQEYTRKGITMFSAAIGDDKENIKRIYKEGFLDISNLERLPLNLIKLITNRIK